MMKLLFYLIAAHALCDLPLQGDYLAKSKNPNGNGDSAGWQIHLFYHATIQGASVMLLCGSLWLGLAELAIHAVTDYLKCMKRISGRVDQSVHVVCRIAWALIAFYGGMPWLGR